MDIGKRWAKHNKDKKVTYKLRIQLGNSNVHHQPFPEWMAWLKTYSDHLSYWFQWACQSYKFEKLHLKRLQMSTIFPICELTFFGMSSQGGSDEGTWWSAYGIPSLIDYK